MLSTLDLDDDDDDIDGTHSNLGMRWIIEYGF
jgi:hypothetical protein